jgi:cyclic pyranopterin phosphate synthase
MSGLTHFDERGRARMVDVSAKPRRERSAVASGIVRMTAATLAAAIAGGTHKGEVFRTAEIAGIMAAKRTAELVPLCHPLPLSLVTVGIAPDEGLPGVRVTATACATGQTGVEMEALTAVSCACLTVYDMLKAIDRSITIEQIRLDEKTGGSSGHWRRPR